MKFQYLLDALNDQGREILEAALASSALMLEFGDNIEGSITSPGLFSEILHAVYAGGGRQDTCPGAVPW